MEDEGFFVFQETLCPFAENGRLRLVSTYQLAGLELVSLTHSVSYMDLIDRFKKNLKDRTVLISYRLTHHCMIRAIKIYLWITCVIEANKRIRPGEQD